MHLWTLRSDHKTSCHPVPYCIHTMHSIVPTRRRKLFPMCRIFVLAYYSHTDLRNGMHGRVHVEGVQPILVLERCSQGHRLGGRVRTCSELCGCKLRRPSPMRRKEVSLRHSWSFTVRQPCDADLHIPSPASFSFLHEQPDL